MAKDFDGGACAPETVLTHAGRRACWTGNEGIGGNVVNPPVWRASTTLYKDMADFTDRAPHDRPDKLYYGRRGTPSAWALADALTQLEPGAAGTLLFSSGVQAITFSLQAMLKPGDHVLCVDCCYSPTRAFLEGYLKSLGITTSYYDPMIGAKIANLVQDNTKLIILESPGSHSFEVQDMPAIIAVAREKRITTFIDNTWASPLFFPAIEAGIDIAMMSCTKYVGGHSDLMMGCVTVAPALWDQLRQAYLEFGYCVGADDAALALRGLRSMGVRLKAHEANAMEVATWLKDQPWVGRMLHPAFEDCPGHEYWKRDFKGASGLFGFALKGADAAARARFIDALTLFGLGYSWGGYESMAMPTDLCGKSRTAAPWTETDPYVRVHIGLEDPADLIADLAQAAKQL